MMNQLKRLILFRPSMPTIQSKKTDYDTKIGEIDKKIIDHDHNDKGITTQEFNQLKSENVAARLKQANLAIKFDIDDFGKKSRF